LLNRSHSRHFRVEVFNERFQADLRIAGRAQTIANLAQDTLGQKRVGRSAAGDLAFIEGCDTKTVQAELRAVCSSS
jgi:hypothetical protein